MAPRPDLSPEEEHELFKQHLSREILRGTLCLGLGLIGSVGVVVAMLMLPYYLSALLEQAAYVTAGVILMIAGVTSMQHILPVLRWIIADSGRKADDDKK